MQRIVAFDRNGHDSFIDFIKAYAIIWVLIGHTITHHDWIAYNVWGGIQVPLFILVQVFHAYKKETCTFDIRKTMKRIVLPFLVVTLAVFLLVSGAYLATGHSVDAFAAKGLKGGGYGPGAYFPWIYVQMAILLPLFAKCLGKVGRTWGAVLFLLMCEGIEVLCSLVDVPEWLYRLMAVRYLFLVFLGWQWVKEGVRINTKMIVLSALSLASIIYFEYFSVNDEPWFFQTVWTTHRWPCYYFMAQGFTALLHALWTWMRRSKRVVEWVEILASASYEIFLVQMAFLYLWGIVCAIVPLSEGTLSVLRFVLCWVVSLSLGIYASRRRKSVCERMLQ